MKIITLIFLCFFHITAFATLPGDEDMLEGSRFCDYQKYKNRNPYACPKVEQILSSVSVYGDIKMSYDYTEYLKEKIKEKLLASKRHETKLTRAIVDSRDEHYEYFDQESRIQKINDNQFLIKINIKTLNLGDKKIIVMNNFLGSSKTIYSYSKIIEFDDKKIDETIKIMICESLNEVKSDVFLK